MHHSNVQLLTRWVQAVGSPQDWLLPASAYAGAQRFNPAIQCAGIPETGNSITTRMKRLSTMFCNGSEADGTKQ
jgi:hypothetical protein